MSTNSKLNPINIAIRRKLHRRLGLIKKTYLQLPQNADDSSRYPEYSDIAASVEQPPDYCNSVAAEDLAVSYQTEYHLKTAYIEKCSIYKELKIADPRRTKIVKGKYFWAGYNESFLDYIENSLRRHLLHLPDSAINYYMKIYVASFTGIRYELLVIQDTFAVPKDDVRLGASSTVAGEEDI